MTIMRVNGKHDWKSQILISSDIIPFHNKLHYA